MNENINNHIESYKFQAMTPYFGKEKPITLQCRRCLTIKELKQAKNCLRPLKCKICDIHPSRKYTLESVIEICNNKNIQFLGTYYKNCHIKYSFKCNQGHVWQDTFGEIIRKFKKGSNGCRQCANASLRKANNDVIIELQHKQIKLLETYINNRTKHFVECMSCEHKWSAQIGPILQRDVGCPKCKCYFNEKLTGQYIKELLPNCLLEHNHTLYEEIKDNQELIRKYLFIDYKISILDITIFVEYNGVHHYKETNYRFSCPIDKTNITEKFRKQVIRDKWLRSYCESHNIFFIEIDGRKYKEKDIKDYLLSEFSKIIPSQEILLV